MNIGDVLHLAQSYGAAGMIVAYFAWRDWRRDQRDDKREAERLRLERERIEADLEVARGFVMFATKLDVLADVRRL
ncbi:MAG: hypothetical protein J2O44_08195 [Porphyrobacter sp.]|nr:hypothetical protein [Porphyrobacter sp.]